MAKLNNRGFTLVEVVSAVLLLSLTIGAMLMSFIVGRVSIAQARQSTQVMNLIRAKTEELVSGSYSDVQDEESSQVVIDPGADGEWDTDDDLYGTIWVTVADIRDIDKDGDFDEQEIDADGDGLNDFCKPVNVVVTWTFRTCGIDTPKIASLDTLITKR